MPSNVSKTAAMRSERQAVSKNPTAAPVLPRVVASMPRVA
jgi:hypothetical protein